MSNCPKAGSLNCGEKIPAQGTVLLWRKDSGPGNGFTPYRTGLNPLSLSLIYFDGMYSKSHVLQRLKSWLADSWLVGTWLEDSWLADSWLADSWLEDY
jgi:hypothetical protein